MSHHQKQSFFPYAVMIITAVILIAAANAVAVYYVNIATVERDASVIQSQQYIIGKLAQDYQINTHILNQTAQDISLNNHILNQTSQGINMNLLYQGQILYQLSNNTKKLQSLIDAHNEMIQAIENATGHHTPIINVHNSFCSIYVVKPECHKK